MKNAVKIEHTQKNVSEIECYKLPRSAVEEGYSRISVNELADLGVTFAPLIPTIKEAAENAEDGGIFKMILSDVSAIGAASKLCTVISVEPTVVLMAVAMTSVNKKLGSIEKKQTLCPT